MARREARLKTRIWDDDDFLDLGRPEQLAYIFVLSQPDISHTGVLALRLKRWAKKLKYQPEQFWKILVNLENTRFVVVDEDEEELLVRSFIRNDEVYKQPKVLLAASRQLAEANSPKIRQAIAEEIDRILREGMAGENTRPTLLKMLGSLGRVADTHTDSQVNTLSDTHSGTHPEGYAEGIPEGHPIPDAMGTGVGVGEGEGFKTVGGSSSSSNDEAEKETKKKTTPAKRGSRIPEDFTVSDDLCNWAEHKAPLAFAEIDYQTEQFVDYWNTRTGQIAIKIDWPRTWRSWMRKANKDLTDRADRRSTPQGPKSTAPERLDESKKCSEHRRALPCGLCRAEQMGATQDAA